MQSGATTPVSPTGTTATAGQETRAVLEAFSRGELTTRQVTAKLGVEYREVLDLLHDAGLPRYRLPDEVARPMIDDFVALITPVRQ